MQKAWPCVSQLESFWLNLFHLHFPTVREQCHHSHLHLVRGHQCARLGCVAHNSKSPVFMPNTACGFGATTITTPTPTPTAVTTTPTRTTTVAATTALAFLRFGTRVLALSI